MICLTVQQGKVPEMICPLRFGPVVLSEGVRGTFAEAVSLKENLGQC